VILYPAIDLKDGRCVRLKQGDMEQATVFNEDAAAQARAFEEAGFEWLHVVDLNGAFAGRSVNAEAIRAIRAAIKIPMQLGGAFETWRVSRPGFRRREPRHPRHGRSAQSGFRQGGGALASGPVGRGHRCADGFVAVEGWAEASTLSAIELGKRFEDAGVAAIIFTDIARDGMLEASTWRRPPHSRAQSPFR
jgi:phosphoribosylformimino-5-aminoimidazole carboxamide ribotide isomerase